jgi:hypothetical protein
MAYSKAKLKSIFFSFTLAFISSHTRILINISWTFTKMDQWENDTTLIHRLGCAGGSLYEI